MDDAKFKTKVFDKLDEIMTKLTRLETHAEYTKKGVQENRKEIKRIGDIGADHEARIRSLEEFRQMFSDVIWEVLKGPLALVGLVIVVAIGIMGVFIYLQ